MQPEHNQSLPPVNSSPVVPPSAPIPGESQPNKPKGPPKWLWFVIGGIVLLLIAGGIWALSLIMSGGKGGSQQGPNGNGKLSKLTIGSQPYVYPCSVATEADYARIFGLDNPIVGTVTETSALPLDEIKATDSDLTKIAPVSRDRYNSDCSYTLAKNGATKTNPITISLLQTPSEDEVAANFKSSRSSAAGDFSSDGVDNGTHQLTVLPSFPTSSYVRLPDADSVLPGLKAVFTSGTRMVTLEYSFAAGQNSDTTLPLLDAYAKAIQAKLNEYKDGKPVDLTGRTTFTGKKFVDICKKAGIAKFGETFGGLEIRPDEATSISIYGSLEGSRAAEDGVESYCKVGFNTPGDRQAQAAFAENKRSSSTLDADDLWPHNLTVTTNSLRTAQEAKTYVAGKKSRSSSTTVRGGGAPVVEDLVGIGEGGYKLHKEFSLDAMFSGEASQRVTIEDTYVIISGGDVITLSLQQIKERKNYQTAPVQPTEASFKKAYETVKETLASNR